MILTKKDRKAIRNAMGQLDRAGSWLPGERVIDLLDTLDAWQENAERLAARLRVRKGRCECRGACADCETLAAHRKLKGEG